jgi:PAS domain S-box-containing protein
MQAAALPPDEAERLTVLRHLDVLDSGPEEEFDALVKVASLVCGVPISLISLVDAERQWFKANIGLPGTTETPRDVAFCAHAILDDDLFVVGDALADRRFADNPLVASVPDIRFYAGAPITLSDGHRVGTLCVIDRQPRTLDASQREILRSLAMAAAQALEGRRAIRELQKVSAALVKNKELLDRTSSMAQVGGWELDLRTNVLYWSDETCRIHGVEPGFVPTLEQAITFYAPEIRSAIQEAVAHAIATGQPWELESPMLRQNGERIWVRAVGSVEQEGGQAVRLVGAFQDVTAQRKETLELEDARERVALATESGGIGIWDVDLLTHVVHWDPQSFRLHGCDPALGETSFALWLASLHPDDRHDSEQTFRTSLAHREDYAAVYRVVWPDGSVHHIKGFGRLRCDSKGQPVRMVGTNIDVTETVNRARYLEESRDRAREATQSKGQFLANMSHEIRTPMNAILGMLTLLGNTALSGNQHDYLSKADGAARSLLALLNDILDFSKIDAGKMELELRPFRLDRLMRELAVVLSANVGSKTIEVLYEIDPTIPGSLLGDSMRLRQVLINLAGNAIKFTSVGQVLISLKSEPQPAESGLTRVHFSVQDSGIGIASENQTRIFGGFNQAEASTSRRFGGTGLGLAISKRLVELMGGEIRLVSAVGAGSTFSFALDMLQAAYAGPSLSGKVANATLSQPNRVLVVDDNAVSRKLLTYMMHSFGWQVDAEPSGAKALERLATFALELTNPYQCIYIDWQMPEMNGWETLHHLTNLHQRWSGDPPRYIMLTSNSRDSLAQRTQGEQRLVSALLVKPFTASMVMNASMVQLSDSESVRRAPRSSKRRLSGMRVLVVEDNAINQQVAEELLGFEGALVSIVGDGRQAVNAISSAKTQFDAVLMDVQMPVMDGYAATRVIRDELGLLKLPIIGLTANAMASDREACLNAGMDDHVGKPFDVSELIAVLVRLVWPEGDAASLPVALPRPVVHAALAASDAPEMDLPSALARLGGKKSVYVRAATEMQRTLTHAVHDLSALLAAGDFKRAQTLLHTWKGNAGTLGLGRLTPVLTSWEKQCRDPHATDQLLANVPALEASIASAQSALDTAVAALEHELPKPALNRSDAVDSQHAQELLQTRLVPLLQAHDLSALQVFAELQGALDGWSQTRLDRLENAMQALDFTEALEICLEDSASV